MKLNTLSTTRPAHIRVVVVSFPFLCVIRPIYCLPYFVCIFFCFFFALASLSREIVQNISYSSRHFFFFLSLFVVYYKITTRNPNATPPQKQHRVSLSSQTTAYFVLIETTKLALCKLYDLFHVQNEKTQHTHTKCDEKKFLVGLLFRNDAGIAYRSTPEYLLAGYILLLSRILLVLQIEKFFFRSSLAPNENIIRKKNRT